MIDNRTKLPENYLLRNKGVSYQIIDEIGRGVNNIVYNALCYDRDGIKHLARVKELYPVYYQIERGKEFNLRCNEINRKKFEESVIRFEKTYEKNVIFRNKYGVINSAINMTGIFKANGTEYVVMNLDEGEDYQSYKDEGLTETLIHVKVIASMIAKYHEDGYLHLDIKPENVLIIPGLVAHLCIFDFDSVCKMSELQSKNIIDLSFSEGFSAPEKVQGNISKIGPETDIYSIGALLFFKLFNRKPTIEDGRYAAKFNYQEMPFYNKTLGSSFLKKFDEFFHKTLVISPILRWNTMEQVIDSIDELLILSDQNSNGYLGA